VGGTEVRRLGVKLLAVVFAALVVLVVLPLPPNPAGPGLDASWAQGLHIAIERGFAFGTQLVFTYGPLGFVHARMYWPGLFAVTLVFWLVLALGVADGWWGTARGHGALVIAAAAILLVALGFASAYAFDTIVFVYLLLWVWQSESRPAQGRVRLAAHGTTIGIIALSKLTFGAAGATALAAVAVILAARGQWRIAWIPVAASLLAFLLGWVALGQSLAALPAYVVNGMQIVTGYTEAMALRGPLWELRAFGWAVVFLLGIAIAAAWRQRGVSTWSALGFTVVMVALAWKQGFTRHDGHVAAGFAFAIALGAVLAARFSATAPWRAAAMIAVAAGIVGAFLLSIERRDQTARFAAEIVARRPLDALRSLGNPHHWQVQREAVYAAMRADQPIPPLPGSVDVYSYDQAPAFAHGLSWNPRPVIQSYSAYTAPLHGAAGRHEPPPSRGTFGAGPRAHARAADRRPFPGAGGRCLVARAPGALRGARRILVSHPRSRARGEAGHAPRLAAVEGQGLAGPAGRCPARARRPGRRPAPPPIARDVQGTAHARSRGPHRG
jgi:hypothetical protein